MGKTILIVDDEAFIRVLLEQTLEDLESQGVEILLAEDGEAGLDLAITKQPDLVLLDVMMPRVNGYQACQRIKEYNEKIYVILLTAKGQSVDKEQGVASGADEYITKPFDPDYIVQRATAILDIEL